MREILINVRYQEVYLFKPKEFPGPFLYLHVSMPQTKSFFVEDNSRVNFLVCH